MAHVFISYKHEDGDFAELLKSKLGKGRFQTWLDSDIQGGEKWSPAIDNAIENSLAVIVIMSPEARKSEYITYEWAFALGLKKPVVPILLKVTELHPKLAEFQYMDFTNYKIRPWDKLITRLKTLAKAQAVLVTRSEPQVQPKPTKTTKATNSVKTNQVSEIPIMPKEHPFLTKTIEDLLIDVEKFIFSLGNDVQLKQNKQYIACKKDAKKTNFASIVVNVKSILVLVKLNPDQVDLEPGFTRDVRNIGIWGTGDLEIRLNNRADFEKAKSLIAKSYELN